MENVTLTKYLIGALQKEGVSHVFMIPGGYVDNFAKDIVNTDGVEAIVCASEGGAAMMADGFARASRSPAACMAISGPGASNMMTALSMSKVDGIPVLVITGDNPLVWRNRDSIQDAGTAGLNTNVLLSQVVSRQYEFYDATLAPDYLRRTFHQLFSSESGPVHLAVPMDKQVEKISHAYPSSFRYQSQARAMDSSQVDKVFERLCAHKRIAVLIGSGVRNSQATESLRLFAERFHLPVMTTMGAKGDFPETHPLSWGVFGWAGSQIANETVLTDELDCLLVVGSKLGQIATMCWDERLPKGRELIQIDVNPLHLNQTYVADLPVVADADEAFKFFSRKAVEHVGDDWLGDVLSFRRRWLEQIKSKRQKYYVPASEFMNCTPLHPAYVVSEISSKMPENTQVFVDNGAHTFFSAHYWLAREENSYFSAIKYSGAMGWAVPAAIGAKFTRPDLPTVAIVGDGCMLMHGVEVQTAARYGLGKIVFVVINNSAHGNPKLRLGELTEAEQEPTNIPDHDWAGFARSLGVAGYTINQAEELEVVLSAVLELDEPVLLDVKCGLYETPTMEFDASFMSEFNRYINKDDSEVV